LCLFPVWIDLGLCFIADKSDFTYYSYVTLTTLGYGDIIPISTSARSLALLEAMMGQLYLAVLVARLVGLHISQSMMKKSR
jgi:voltage-gated potassium channel Kch